LLLAFGRLPRGRDLQWVADPDDRNYGFGEREAQRFAEEQREVSIDPDYLDQRLRGSDGLSPERAAIPSMSIPKTTNSTIPKNASAAAHFRNEVLAIRFGFVITSTAWLWQERAGMADSLWMLRAQHLFLVPVILQSALSSAGEPAMGTRRTDFDRFGSSTRWRRQRRYLFRRCISGDSTRFPLRSMRQPKPLLERRKDSACDRSPRGAPLGILPPVSSLKTTSN